MKRIRRWFWPIWVLATLFGLSLVVFEMFDLLGYSGQLVGSVMPVEELAVAGPNRVGQTFVAARHGLCRVDLLLYGFRRHNTQQVIFHLRRQGEEKDLVRLFFSAAEVRGWRWKTFDFPPIPDSGGKGYELSVDSSSSTPEDSLSPSGIRGDVYPWGASFFLGVPADGDLAFKTFYAGVSLPDKVTALENRITAHKPGPWAATSLYLVLAGWNLTLAIGLGAHILFRGWVAEG